MHRRPQIQTQSGNALFLVLIGVALFAMLSLVITQSGRNTGGSIDREKTILSAAQITQYGATMRAGAMRMMLTGTATPATLAINDGGTGPCTTGATCLFSSTGGGVSIPKLPKNIGSGAFQQFSPASWGYSFAGVTTNAANYWEVDDISEEVCQAINDGLGITGIPTEVDQNDTIYDAAPGKAAACVNWDNTGLAPLYWYYAVIAEEQ